MKTLCRDILKFQTVDKVSGFTTDVYFKSYKVLISTGFIALFLYNYSIKYKVTQNADKKREQMQIFFMDNLVPQDHLLRIIDKAADWTYIYDLVKDRYSHETGSQGMASEACAGL